MKSQGFNPHTRHASRSEAAPERLHEEWRKDKTDRVKAIAARCVQCLNTAEAIRACPRASCALFVLRPYQFDVAPKSAPHNPYRGLAGFGMGSIVEQEAEE